MQLAALDKIVNQLASIECVEDAVDLRNKAKAIETYTKSIEGCKQIERSAIVIRLRCERRLGELLEQITKPGRKRSHDATISLSDLGVSKSASSRYQLASKLDRETFEEFVETAKTSELSTSNVIGMVRQQEREAERHGPSRGHNVFTGDISCLYGHLDDGSVDLFLTDPPYDRDSVHLYSELAKLAATKLKPGGLCVAYAGLVYLPQVMAAMGEHLAYFGLLRSSIPASASDQSRVATSNDAGNPCSRSPARRYAPESGSRTSSKAKAARKTIMSGSSR